jgi:hypothetical protein
MKGSMLLTLLGVFTISGIIGAYFYFRPPVIKPLCNEALRDAIRVANRQRIHEEL